MRHPKILVMTGGTSGIGRRMLERLLVQSPEWQVLLFARPSAQSEALTTWANDAGFGLRCRLIDCDLADLASVDSACTSLLHSLGGASIHAMALNAGVQAVQGDQASADGVELSFAVNHLAHVLIVERLASSMRVGARVILTASEVHDPEAFCLVGITRARWQEPADLADPSRAQDHLSERVDRGEARYCASKLMNVMHVRHLAQARPNISSIAFNPSVVPGTGIARERNILQIFGWKYVLPMLAPILPGVRSIERSASDLLWLVTGDTIDGLSGCYVDGREVKPGSPESRDTDKIAQVMAYTRRLLQEKTSIQTA